MPHPTRRLAGVVAVLCAAFSAPSASAESVPADCERPFWEVERRVPLELNDVPVRPTLLLPVTLGPFSFDADPALMTPELLEVEVTDAASQAVAGTLDRVPRLSGVGAIGDTEAIEGVLRWRPDADLTPGARYEAKVKVAARPQGWHDGDCPGGQAFEQTVVFHVALEAPPVAIGLVTAVEGKTSVGFTYGRCGSPQLDLACVSPDDMCCKATPNKRWHVSATVSVDTRRPSIYSAVELSYEQVPVASGPRDAWFYPVTAQPFTDEHTQGGEGRPPAGALCVTATLYDLMVEPWPTPVATVRSCPDLAAYVEEPTPVVTACPADTCSTFPPAEPGPETAEAEGGEEVADGEPSGGELDDVADSSEAEATAEAESDRSGGGCAGGGLGLGVLWAGLVIGARRRRWGRHA